MKIEGSLRVNPPIADASHLKVHCTEDGNAASDLIVANVSKTGKFSVDDKRTDGWKQAYLTVCAGEQPIATAGPFDRRHWQEIVIDIAADLADPPDRAPGLPMSVKGGVLDITGVTVDYSDLKVSARYLLQSETDGAVAQVVTSPVTAEGRFELTFGKDAGDGVTIDRAGVIGLGLTEKNGALIAFDCFIAAGDQRTQNQNPRLSDLDRGTSWLAASFKMAGKSRLADKLVRPIGKAQSPAELELRFRSTAVIRPSVSVDRPTVDANKKLRGRVVEKAGTLKIRNCQVILYGVPKAAEDAKAAPAPQVLGICVTDGEGNFSCPYPKASFASAFAVVAVKPDEPKEIILGTEGNYPDFVWLILESLPPEMTQDEHDDCACKGGSTPTLPDMDELLENGAYAQDIGGSCVNFTTPNRALEEYSYKMVVRTSDPDLFNLDEETLRDRIEDLNARIAFIKRQLGSLSYMTIDPALLQKSVKSAIETSGLVRAAQPIEDSPAAMRVTAKAASATASITSRAIDIDVHHAQMTEIYARPARNLLSHTVNNANARLLRSELASLQNELKKVQRLINYKGRVPLDGTNPIDWDDSDSTLGVVQASTIAYGHILNYKQVWRAAGYSLGDLLYSLPLAPGQKKQIAVFDWDRRETASETQALDYRDNLSNAMSHQRDISEIVGSTLSESNAASSHNKSEGSAVGAGVGGGTSGSGAGAGSYGGFSLVGAATGMLGISGGASRSSGESWSDASQNSMRNLAASTEQNLRESTMQNAASVRSQRSSVVTTVGQSESFRITTEVVANHNHCHALTIQYFEVLRHYAIYQELSDVQECLFVPMYIDGFDERKVLRWRDILSTYLFAPRDKIANLRAGFDALQRKADDAAGDPDAYADFPAGRFCDEAILDLSGNLQLELYVARPLSTVTLPDDASLQVKRDKLASLMQNSGLAAWLPGWQQMIANVLNGLDEKIDENFQKELEWANMPEEFVQGFKVYALRHSTGGESLLSVDISLVGKTNLGSTGASPYGARLGHYQLTLSIRQGTFQTSIPRSDIRGIVIRNNNSLPYGSSCLLKGGDLQYTTEHYAGTLFSNRGINNDVAKTTNPDNGAVIGDSSAYIGAPMSKDELRNPRREDVRNLELLMTHLNTNREHYHTKLWMLLNEQRLYNLLDKYSIDVPKLRYASGVKDGEAVYGIVLDDDGDPVIDHEQRSVASVVELKRLGMAGNSIIFPVARGLNLNPDFLLVPEFEIVDDVELPQALAYKPLARKAAFLGDVVNLKTRTRLSRIGRVTGESKVSLVDLYKPLPGTREEPKPFRISVPTKGLFAEAVPGACNSCEKIDDSRFWKWEEHPIDEPTAIQPISTDSRRSEPLNTQAKDFPAPIINIQTPAAAPDPQGLANALMLMGKSDVFKDITGLDQTQKNALQALLTNQEAAQFFAKQAADLAIESGRQTQHAADTVANYDLAKRSQKMQVLDKIQDLPVDADTKQKYIDAAMNDIVGDKESDVSGILGQAAAKSQDQDGITSQQSIDRHADQGRDVEAAKNGEYIKISGGKGTGGTSMPSGETGDDDAALTQWTDVPRLKQANPNACWATAATMMMSWKKKQPALAVADVLSQAGQVYLDKFNNGEPLFSGEKAEFIEALGMMAADPANYPKEFYIDRLRTYGPLWVTTDSSEANGAFSPHARILTAIQDGADPLGTDTRFTFNDPATGSTSTQSFQDFVSVFEQMVTDNAGDLFVQIVHFKDKAPGGPEGGGTGEGNATPQQRVRTFVPQREDTLVVNGVEGQLLAGLVNWRGLYKDAAGDFSKATMDQDRTFKDTVENKQKYVASSYRAPAQLQHIVLHETAGFGDYRKISSFNIETYKQNGVDKSQYKAMPHFCVNRDGSIIQFLDPCEKTWHGEDLDATAIGIEFVNNPWVQAGKQDGKTAGGVHPDIIPAIGGGMPTLAADKTKTCIYIPSAQQLEALATLVEALLAHDALTSLENTWMSEININPTRLVAKGATPAETAADGHRYFIMNNVRSYLKNNAQYAGLSGITIGDGWSLKSPGVFYHGMYSASHADGMQLALYTWLRLKRGIDSAQALATMREILADAARREAKPADMRLINVSNV